MEYIKWTSNRDDDQYGENGVGEEAGGGLWRENQTYQRFSGLFTLLESLMNHRLLVELFVPRSVKSVTKSLACCIKTWTLMHLLHVGVKLCVWDAAYWTMCVKGMYQSQFENHWDVYLQ